jgi:hypothetical protein
MIDLTAARRHLAEKLPAGEEIEIVDETILNTAAAIVVDRKVGA